MKIGVASAALEYAVTVTVLSVPAIILGFGATEFIDAIYSGLLSQISIVVLGI